MAPPIHRQRIHALRTPTSASNGEQPSRRMVIIRTRRSSTPAAAGTSPDETDLGEQASPAEADQPVVVRRVTPPPPGDPIPAVEVADPANREGPGLDRESLIRKRQETAAVFVLLEAALGEHRPHHRRDGA